MNKKVNSSYCLSVLILVLVFVGCSDLSNGNNDTAAGNETPPAVSDPSDVSTLTASNAETESLNNSWTQGRTLSTNYAQQPFLQGNTLYFIGLESESPVALYRQGIVSGIPQESYAGTELISTFTLAGNLTVIATADKKIYIGDQESNLGYNARKILYDRFNGNDYLLFHHDEETNADNQAQFSLYKLDQTKKELLTPPISQDASADNAAYYRVFDFYKGQMLALKGDLENRQNPVLALGAIEIDDNQNESIIWRSFTKAGNNDYTAAHFIDSENVVLLAHASDKITLYWFEINNRSLYAKKAYTIQENTLENSLSNYDFFYTDAQRKRFVLQLRPTNTTTVLYAMSVEGDSLKFSQSERQEWVDLMVTNEKIYAIGLNSKTISSIAF